MSRRIAPTAALATALMVAVLISSCDSEDSPEVAPPSPARAAELPPGFDVTFRWTVNDNFDPLSAEGTFVRAYVESFYLANEGQSTKWAYPGFVSASPTDIEQRVRERECRGRPCRHFCLRRCESGADGFSNANCTVRVRIRFQQQFGRNGRVDYVPEECGPIRDQFHTAGTGTARSAAWCTSCRPM